VDPATSWPYTLMNIYEVANNEKKLIASGIIWSGMPPTSAPQNIFTANIEYWYPQVETYSSAGRTNLLLERKYSTSTTLDSALAVLIRADKVHWDKAVSISPNFTSTYQQNGQTMPFGFTLDIVQDSVQGQTMTLMWFNSTPSNLMTGVTETLKCAQADVNVATWYCAQ
jgi:hypothetical protein